MNKSAVSSLFFCVIGCTLFSCSESKFAGGGNKVAAAAQAAAEPTVPPPIGCVEGDKINFVWTGDIKECIVDQGKTYNFDQKKCMEMRQATFSCNWDTLFREMTKIRLIPTEKMKAAQAVGSKLVSCGQSQDSNRIVVQWLKTSGPVSCNDSGQSQALITTGCYTSYTDGQSAPGTSANDVYNCMNQL